MSNNDQGPTCGQVVRAENSRPNSPMLFILCCFGRGLEGFVARDGTDCLEAFDKNDHAMDRRAAASNDGA